MYYIAAKWYLNKFPAQAEIPAFRFSSVFGPRFSSDAFDTLLNESTVVEEVDFDTNHIRVLHEPEARECGGDFLYVVYTDPGEWVYIMSTDLEWAFLYSSIDPHTLMSGFDLDAAQQDFEMSLSRRTTVDKNYYDTEKLLVWANAARSNYSSKRRGLV